MANSKEKFYPRKENLIYVHSEALGATEFVRNIKCNLQWVSSGHVLLINNSYLSFCVANIMNIGNIYIYIYV